jgi:hypothetical protein
LLRQFRNFKDERCVVVVGAPIQRHTVTRVEQISSIVTW